jgi:phage terminase large subunit-like protein
MKRSLHPLAIRAGSRALVAAAERPENLYGGLDLASKIDLAAFVLVFPPSEEGGPWDVIARFYCPEAKSDPRPGG